MPPSAVDDTGLCGRWEGAGWLSPAEVSTIAEWADNGALEGRPSEPPAEGARRESAFRKDATLALGGPYRPGIGRGGDRCFVISPGLERDTLVSAVRVRSTDVRGLRQITLFSVDSEDAELELEQLDGADGRRGYPCYGTPRIASTRLVAGWTSGDPVVRLASDVGVRLVANRRMIARVHYDISQAGASYESTTEIDLEIARGTREARVVAMVGVGQDLLPDRPPPPLVVTRFTERPEAILGVTPRMHTWGRVMQLNVVHSGQTMCLATFDHWKYENARYFRRMPSLSLEPGDRIELTCLYKTPHQLVRFGSEVDDEACVATLLVVDR